MVYAGGTQNGEDDPPTATQMEQKALVFHLGRDSGGLRSTGVAAFIFWFVISPRIASVLSTPRGKGGRVPVATRLPAGQPRSCPAQ